ncbi:MAG TPA: hypothetical protein VM802_10505 [Chitinophaga sp.]|uniref:hypothetical protein n=1 Tax=Chitinophaga sp. TaxID=1869181 RepID=UPI002BAFACEB|nr:hypothetical protein [Chitinophaga sp.]HVI45294.1 hypothetical protein [Chitinophaga sp.]
MKKMLIISGIAVTAFICFVSGNTSARSGCPDDHHGLRGKCRVTIVNGTYIFACVEPADPFQTNCTYYVE